MISRRWTGSYTYKSRKLQARTGLDQTNFEIDITFSEGDRFSGTIIDVATTGGTEGVGEISGAITGDSIEFVKRMPVRTVFIGKMMRAMHGKQHRDIYYSGTLSPDAKSASGKWRFKLGFGFIGLLPALYFQIPGVWSMLAR